MVAKHTPGEWSLSTRIASSHTTYVIKGDRGQGLGPIAEIIEFPHEPGVDKANAELILVAPQLYSMLREFVNDHDLPLRPDEFGCDVCMYCGGDYKSFPFQDKPGYIDHSNDCIYPKAQKLLDSIVKGDTHAIAPLHAKSNDN